MQRDTVVTLMGNLTDAILYRVWAFHEGERELALWVDLPENYDLRGLICDLGLFDARRPTDEGRAGHIATITRHVKRVNDHILPAADDLMDSTKGNFTGNDAYDEAFNLLISARNKWVRATQGVITGDDAVAKAQRS